MVTQDSQGCGSSSPTTITPGRDDLFGRREIPDERRPARTVNVETIVDEDVRLQRPDHLDQFRRPPRFAFHLVVTEIEPHDVDLAVVRQQFADLSVEVLQVLCEVARLRFRTFVVATGMETVHGIVRVLPVDERVVKPDAQTFRTKRFDVFTDEVAPGGRLGRSEIGQFAVEQTEALVMLGGEDSIFLPRTLCQPGPLTRIVQVGIELVEVNAIRLVRDQFPVANPFPAGRYRIQSPMDEHPEPRVDPPVRS